MYNVQIAKDREWGRQGERGIQRLSFVHIHVHVQYLLSPSLLPPSAPVVASSPYVQELDVLTLKTIATEASDSMITCIHVHVRV